MKIEITLKSGVQFVANTDLEWMDFKNALSSNGKYPVISLGGDGILLVVSEIAAIRRIEEPTQTFEPVDNDPEKVYERELEKERERWEK